MLVYSAFAVLVLLLSAALSAAPQERAEGAMGRFPLPPATGNEAPIGDPYVVGMTGKAPIRVDVSPRRSMGTKRIRVTTFIEPNPDNRSLVIVLDGPTYFRQDIELNTVTNDDTRTFTRWFDKVPPGRYAVTSHLVRVGGKSVMASTEFCLIGMFENCQ